MAEIKIIATGSSGNCVLLNDGEIAIDCGVPFKMIQPYIAGLKLIVLTHQHGDHFKASTIRKLHKYRPTVRFLCPDYLVPRLSKIVSGSVIDVAEQDRLYKYGSIYLSPFRVVHDVDNVGWRVLLPSQRKILYVTDTGTLDGVVALGYDVYLIEANYTEEDLQRRTRDKISRGEFSYEARAAKTHLSKEQADAFIASNAKPNSRVIYLHEHNAAKLKEGDAM